MRLLVLALFLLALPSPAISDGVVRTAVDRHILPGFAALSEAAARLSETANADCAPDSAPLVASFRAAFDTWLAVSHLRFGPTETEDRGFALAFWPDPRSKTPKALARLIADADPVVADPGSFGTVSVAARGFYALERLLFDEALTATDPGYTCTLVRAIAADIAVTSRNINADWVTRHAPLMLAPGSADNPYGSTEDALRELFKALGTGLQFTSEMRLGRPLGTFERPRPRRAEAWLSGRSLRHVALGLTALEDLALILAAEHPAIAETFAVAFRSADAAADAIEDPVFALLARPQGRLKVEILQQRVDNIRDIARGALGPALGVSQGFNALDGD